MVEIDFQLLFEVSPDRLLVLAPDPPTFTIVGASDAYVAVTHLTRAALIGRGLFEVFPDNPDDPTPTGVANLRASLERVLASRAPDAMAVQQYDIRGPDGAFQTRYWSPRNLPALGPTGEVRYLLHRVEDVTELVRATERGDELRERTHAMERDVIARSRELAIANRELREANARLGELDAAKTAFFGNVSHELRTPLTLMLGPLEDALADRDAPLAAGQRARVALAHGNALRLRGLVDALLDFARLEAGRLHVRFAPLDLARATAEIATMFQTAVERAGLALAIDCPPLGEPAWVDRDAWEKIVLNLVSNAFKFTLTGAITVRLRATAACLALEVVDTGVGIPREDQGRVFERFHRVAGQRGRTHEGTGIGLALVRELVELHGGRVTLVSEVGHGTTFRVELPRGRAHLPPELVHADAEARASAAPAQVHVARAEALAREVAAAPTVATGRARVLVVDDNAELRGYIAQVLAPHVDVTAVGDGRAALDAVATALPELIVSDVMMPRLDGFGLVRALRAAPATASVPVILLSARAGEDAAIDGLDVGADDYVSKPFSARELVARVRTHVALARTRRAWIAELERANRELDAFSYSVSHDLRAPLRAIDGFSQLLASDCAALLDARGREYLARIAANVARMATLIDDLLGLARITRAELRAEAVDLTALARGVVAELRRAHPDREVHVAIDPALAARGDRRLLQIALVNLIGNAWKFSARVAAARIEVGRTDDGFFVRDNGAGFDMAYAGRLFAPFQRLHGAAEFEGTGIGLATVQRVIDRHGGRVWAEAVPGAGATFWFTVPGASPAAA